MNSFGLALDLVGRQVHQRPRLAAALAAVDLAAVDLGDAHPDFVEAALRNPGLWSGPGWEAPTPAEAWDALATRGVVPMSWLDDPRRGFASKLEGAVWPAPLSLASAVAIASDPPGVAAAEEIAREAARRIEATFAAAASPGRRQRRQRPRKGVPPAEAPAAHPVADRVAWVVLAGYAPLFADDVARRGLGAALSALARAGFAGGESLPLTRESAALAAAQTDEDRADAWDRLLPQRPNPFRPLADLWALGYALHRVTDDLLWMVAPSVLAEEHATQTEETA